MSRHESVRYKLSYGWLRGEDWWGDPVSDNFVRTDMLLHPWVKSMVEHAPPEVFSIGDMFIVGGITGDATGDWENHETELAIATENGWVFCKPTKGVRIGSEAPAGWYFWKDDVDGWQPEENVFPVPPTPEGSRYDVILSVGYEAEPLEIMPLFTAPQDMTWRDTAVDSVGRCMASPISTVDIAIFRNMTAPGEGEQIGIVRFSPDSTQAGFIVAGDKAIPKGTMVVAQMPEDLPAGFSVFTATMRFTLNQ